MAKKKNSLADQITDTLSRLEAPEDTEQKKAVAFAAELYVVDKNYNFYEELSKLVMYAEKHGHTYAYIIHDQDRFSVNTFDNNYKLQGKAGDIKQKHCHFVMLFKNGNEYTLSDVLKNINIQKRFFKPLAKSKIENMVLYLSHIKYPEKHYYDPSLIVTNNKDYVMGLHENYHPASAVSFVIAYLDSHKSFMKFGEMWHIALDQYKVPYSDYFKHYALIKDIINQHNNLLQKELDQTVVIDRINENARIKASAETDKILSLADNFGVAQIEKNGKVYTIQCTGEVQKPKKRRRQKK